MAQGASRPGNDQGLSRKGRMAPDDVRHLGVVTALFPVASGVTGITTEHRVHSAGGVPGGEREHMPVDPQRKPWIRVAKDLADDARVSTHFTEERGARVA